MTAEISSSRPIAPTASVARPSVASTELAIKLLQPLAGLLSAGESAEAEVIALKEQAQSFQLVLKLTLENYEVIKVALVLVCGELLAVVFDPECAVCHCVLDFVCFTQRLAERYCC